MKDKVKEIPGRTSLRGQDIVINDCIWKPVKGCKYRYDYYDIAERIVNKEVDVRRAYQELVQNDLWFICYFVLGIPIANHPHWVDMCNMVQDGPDTNTVDVWARDHGKSSIITTAETIQDICKNPNIRICILSYARSAAISFLRQIKHTFETSQFLKDMLPHIFYENPEKQAPTWSEEGGLWVKRRSKAKEGTLEAYGLITGMPTGRHYDKLIYDDIITQDIKDSPEQIRKIKETFDASLNLGTPTGRKRVIGTFYSHDDPLTYVIGKRDLDGNPVYEARIIPATTNGEANGPSRYLPVKRLAELQTSDPYVFNCQQLCNPTPMRSGALDFNSVKLISRREVPSKVQKYMVIDPAGMNTLRVRRGDSWAIGVFGVMPYLEDSGHSKVYILDMIVQAMDEEQALKTICDMYMRNGRILKVGIEKVGISTMEIHVANALRTKGVHLSTDIGNLVCLRPKARIKAARILQSLVSPLNNSKIHLVKDLGFEIQDRIRTEMEKFPYWHDDALDIMSYLYDILAETRFSHLTLEDALEFDEWEDAEDEEDDNQIKQRKWMVV